MNLLSDFFLRAKHWQIFLLVFGVCFIGQVVLVTGAHSAEELGRASLMRLGLGVALTMLGFVLWFWSTGTFLCSLVRPDLRPRLAFFRAAIICPVVFAFAVPSFFMSPEPWLFAVMMATQLFALVCLIYDVHFVAKSLALVLTGEPKSLSDFGGTFVLLWLFPIGIWIIQPKINQLYKARGRPAFPAR
jgi:hypothetical protein